MRSLRNKQLRSPSIEPFSPPLLKTLTNIFADDFLGQVKKPSYDKYWNKLPQIDPRDIKILIPSDQIIKYFNDNFDDQQKIILRDWLVHVHQSVLSDSFIRYHKGQLTQSQIKAYSAKNLLYNIYNFLHKLEKKLQLETRNKIIHYLDGQSSRIISQLLIKYPQVASKYASRKLKNAISRPDNRQSDQFDLFRYSKTTKIKFQYRQDKNYSSEIMKALNYLMEISSQSLDQGSNPTTIYDAFQLLLDSIFTLSGCPTFQKEFFQKAELYESGSDASSVEAFEELFAIGHQGKQIVDEFKRKRQRQQSHKINQKIPSGCRIFTQQQIQAGSFRIPDASILRIITKWAQQLRQKLKNCRQSILKRVQLFKTKTGDLIQIDQEQRQLIYQAAQQQQQRINKYFQNIKKQCLKMSQKISVDYYQNTLLNPIDTNLAIFASRIQSCIGQYMFQYLKQLIHSLLKVPVSAKNKYLKKYQYCRKQQLEQIQSLNLISFKIGDLLRARYKSTERNIISTYGFIEKLSQKCPKLFKIVRIKDRLDSKDNDILLNFYFMGKVQCQIQLSVASSTTDAKQEHFNHFNHFIYELKRAQLGPIAQCACILTQYDPLTKYYSQKQLITIRKQKQQKTPSQQILQRSFSQKVLNKTKQQQKSNLNTLPFYCTICQQFKKNSNPNFYSKRLHCTQFYQCNQCHQKKLKKQNIQILIQQLFRQVYLKKSGEMEFLLKHFQLIDQNSINSFQDVQNLRYGFIIMKNTNSPQPQYFQAISVQQMIYITVYKQSLKDSESCKVLMSLSPYNSIQKIKKQLSTAFILKHKVDSSTMITKKKQSTELKILQCKCCKKKQFQIGYSSFAKKLTIKKLNVQQIKNINKKQKQVLYLVNKNITDQLSIYKMNYIKRLYLKNNPNILLNYLNNFQNIILLDISSNSLDKLPKLSDCIYLKQLYCYNNKLEDLDQINNCKNLQKLICNKNNIKNLSALKSLSNLIELQCNSNKINRLQGLSNCNKLRYLSCGQNELYSLNGIQNCCNLLALSCGNNLLVTLQGLQKCTLIVKLRCDHNQIQSLKGMENCKNLQQLRCENNQLFSLKGLEKCSNLHGLSCQDNQISGLEGLQKCSKLSILWCNHNKLQNLKGLNNCINLSVLWCNNNQINSLTGVQNCENLKTLLCDNNKLTSLAQLQRCNSLLNLLCGNYKYHKDNNQLISLKGLQNCVNLIDLWCNNNQLLTLTGLQNCTKLNDLSICNNQLKTLDGLQNCLKLQNFKYEGNPLINITAMNYLTRLKPTDQL